MYNYCQLKNDNNCNSFLLNLIIAYDIMRLTVLNNALRRIFVNFKLAVFDMDGTLVDSLIFWDWFWKKCGKEFLNDENFRPDAEDDKAARTMLFVDSMSMIHKKYGIAKSGKELYEYGNKAISEFYSSVEIKKGVLEYLEYLKSKNIRMCIASATETDFIKLALKQCGIENYFEKIFSCAEVGKGKEEPDIYLEALKYFGVEAGDACIFEDSLIAIETAKKIGVKTVGIYDKNNFGHEKMQKIADEYISENEDLTKLI